jgi:hypothetical protein
MPRQIDGIGNDCGRSIGSGGSIGEDSDRVCDPKRETAPAPPASRNTTHSIGGIQSSRSEQ